MRGRVRLSSAALAFALAACAATPPGNLVPITDAKAVAGKWQGAVGGNQHPVMKGELEGVLPLARVTGR